jgi:ribosomal protein L29
LKQLTNTAKLKSVKKDIAKIKLFWMKEIRMQKLL